MAMPVWVKAEGASDAEAFRVDVLPQIPTAGSVPDDASQGGDERGAPSPQEIASEPTLHDVLVAAVHLFFPAGGNKRASRAADASKYVLCLSGQVLSNLQLPAEQTMMAALKTALDVNETVVNRHGTISQFMLLRRQGVVFELRHASTRLLHASKKTHRRSAGSSASASPHKAAVARQLDDTVEGASILASSPAPLASSGAAVLWSPRNVVEKALPTHACSAFQPRWGTPVVCDVCMQHASSHAASTVRSVATRRAPSSIGASPSPSRRLLGEGNTPQTGTRSRSPSSKLLGAAAPVTVPGDMVQKSAYTRTCGAFVPLWDHNDHCSNCYRPLHWHDSYLDDLAKKKRVYVRTLKGQASSRAYRRHVLMLPWHAVFHFLSVEDVMTCGCCCRTMATTARVLLKAIMTLVLRHEPPPDAKMRILRDADRIRHSLQAAAKTSMAAAKALVALIACTTANLNAGTTSTSPSSGARAPDDTAEAHMDDDLSKRRSPIRHDDDDDLTLDDPHTPFDEQQGATTHHHLVHRIRQLLTLDVRSLPSEALDAIHDIPESSTAHDRSAAQCTPHRSLFHLTASSHESPPAHAHPPSAPPIGHTSLPRTLQQRNAQHDEDVQQLVVYLRNMAAHRALKDRAAAYLTHTFVAL